jgi:UrcA family protein
MKSAYVNARVALLAGAMLFSAGAWPLPPPGEPVVTRTMTVKYDPATAATAEGAAALYARLRIAASRVCANPDEHLSSRRFDDRRAHGACMSEALDTAVAEIGIAMLTALHAPHPAVPDAAVARR